MKYYLKCRAAVWGSLISFGISCLSIMGLPLLEGSEGKKISELLALVFWLFFILSVAFLKKASSYAWRVRMLLKKKGIRLPKQRAGILNFSSDVVNVVIYVLGIEGLLLLLADMKKPFLPGAVMYPVLSVTMYLVFLHSVIDGKYYKILILYKRGLEDRNERSNE